MRKIRKVHNASYSPIADLITYRPLPSSTVDQIDPFIFLNHHGPQEYPPNNSGLPFGPHPHRGMETVTFIVDGDIMHRDSAGHKSIIEAGGVQWMTAGRGLIHAEVSSEKFREHGGNLEILQLWLNLPASHKMTEPHYIGLQGPEIPSWSSDDGKVVVKIVAGSFHGKRGAIRSVTGVSILVIHLETSGRVTLQIPGDENILLYIVRGVVTVNDTPCRKRQLIEFENSEGDISTHAGERSLIIVGHAKPLNEPVVAQGPFVMNTEEEIMQAYADYRAGKFGLWNE